MFREVAVTWQYSLFSYKNCDQSFRFWLWFVFLLLSNTLLHLFAPHCILCFFFSFYTLLIHIPLPVIAIFSLNYFVIVDHLTLFSFHVYCVLAVSDTVVFCSIRVDYTPYFSSNFFVLWSFSLSHPSYTVYLQVTIPLETELVCKVRELNSFEVKILPDHFVI